MDYTNAQHYLPKSEEETLRHMLDIVTNEIKWRHMRNIPASIELMAEHSDLVEKLGLRG